MTVTGISVRSILPNIFDRPRDDHIVQKKVDDKEDEKIVGKQQVSHFVYNS